MFLYYREAMENMKDQYKKKINPNIIVSAFRFLEIYIVKGGPEEYSKAEEEYKALVNKIMYWSFCFVNEISDLSFDELKDVIVGNDVFYNLLKYSIFIIMVVFTKYKYANCITDFMISFINTYNGPYISYLCEIMLINILKEPFEYLDTLSPYYFSFCREILNMVIFVLYYSIMERY